MSLIIGVTGASSVGAKEAIATIPIVFVAVADPVGLGLVSSLARPGGNVTGLASIQWETFSAKQLEVIKQALPKTSRVALWINPTNPMHQRNLPQVLDKRSPPETMTEHGYEADRVAK